MKNLNKINTKILLLLSFVLLANVSVFTQTKRIASPKKTIEEKKIVEIVKPGERPVTVALKEGEPLKGTFVNASSEGVQIVIAGNTLTLKWNEISQIVFTDVALNEALNKKDSKTNEEVENALKSLRKLAAATEVGVNFQEYGSRLIDVKAEVEEFLVKIPDGYIKGEIKLAMEAYADAGTAWNGFIQGQEQYFNVYPATESGTALLKKYSIEVNKENKFSIERSPVLSIIWAAARNRIENATKGKPEKEVK